MNYWFKVNTEHYEEKGKEGPQKVKESHLTDALSWTEAEARITKEFENEAFPYTITDIKKEKISEIFFLEGDIFFKAKIQYITLDEKKGKEKRTGVNILVQASNMDEAQEVIKTRMADTLSDYVVVEVKETKIVNVFLYKDEGNGSEN
jgi:hypothetical protein